MDSRSCSDRIMRDTVSSIGLSNLSNKVTIGLSRKVAYIKGEGRVAKETVGEIRESVRLLVKGLRLVPSEFENFACKQDEKAFQFSEMEEKLKREAKDYVQKLFKKADNMGAAAIHKTEMKKILKAVLEEYQDSYDAELEGLLLQHVKSTKYTEHNRKTNQFEVKFLEDRLDFPSVLAIVVYFLKKGQKNDAFSGQSVVKCNDFPTTEKLLVKAGSETKKRLF